MTVSSLGYLGIGVSDMEKWEDFGTNVLGAEIPDRAEDGTVYLRIDEYHHRIALHPVGGDDLIYVGWQCANKDEFEATKAALYEGGVEFTQASKEEIENRHVIDMVRFKLSGIDQEVYYGPHFLFEKPFQSPLPHSGFKTTDLGLGHVGMAADDAGEMLRVLTECLGLRVSDFLGGAERFLHANGREHTAVVSTLQPGGKRLGHFMLEVNEFDDVGACLDRVEDQGIMLRSRLGKHTNDHMVSFYMFSPSGFGIEYGYGGRLVDDEIWQVGQYKKASIWGHRRTAEAEARAAAEQQAAANR